jgi:hypothetical protein
MGHGLPPERLCPQVLAVWGRLPIFSPIMSRRSLKTRFKPIEQMIAENFFTETLLWRAIRNPMAYRGKRALERSRRLKQFRHPRRIV